MRGPRRRGRHPLRDAALLAGSLAIIVVATSLGGIVVAELTAPLTNATIRNIEWATDQSTRTPSLPTRSFVYSADGTLIAIFHGEQDRKPVPLDEIPGHVRDAVVAIEDARFRQHRGVDPRALGRALLVNLQTQGIDQGGSTITMQLARGVYLEDDSVTIERKVREMLVAIVLEQQFTKEELLETYLNTIYFGSGAYGIHAAAESFFGVAPQDLTLGQAALLAGLIKEPENINPRRDVTRAYFRRGLVLQSMRALGMITGEQMDDAIAEPLYLIPWEESIGIRLLADSGHHFVEHIKRELLDDPRLGSDRDERVRTLFEGGLRIHTTLDLAAQRAAERIIADILDRGGDPEASLVAVVPQTGAVRALVSGRGDPLGWHQATQAAIQPGSAFKTFTLAAALEAGVPISRTYSAPFSLSIPMPGEPAWRVENYAGAPSGRMSLEAATIFSINTVYAQLVRQIGPRRVVDAAGRMGVTSPLDAVPSVSIGATPGGVSPFEMAAGYATLANDGIRVPPRTITRVESFGGEPIFVNEPDPRRAIAPGVARGVTDVLRKTVTDGTGRRALRLGIPSAGKTGTTSRYRHSWYVGYTDQLATAVHLGTWDDERAEWRPQLNVRPWLPRLFGSSLPAEIWTGFNEEVLAIDRARAGG